MSWEEEDLPSPDDFRHLFEMGMAAQGEVYHFALRLMTDAYLRYETTIKSGQYDKSVEKVLKTHTEGEIKSIVSIFHKFLSNVNQVTEIETPMTVLFLNYYVNAYHLLIYRQNPDNWLMEFMTASPEFVEMIGGWPDWLKKQQ